MFRFVGTPSALLVKSGLKPQLLGDNEKGRKMYLHEFIQQVEEKIMSKNGTDRPSEHSKFKF